MSKRLPRSAAIAHAGARGAQQVLPAAMVKEILTLTDAGKWEQLEAKARVTACRFPAHPLGWKLLGAAHIRRGNYADAVVALTKTTRLLPGDASAHNDLGVALGALGRAEEALHAYRQALKSDARHGPAHSNLGMLLSQLGDRDTAIDHLRQSVECGPAVADSHNNLGTVYRDHGRLVEAEAAYRQALELDAASLPAWINLGHTCNDLEKFGDAQHAYQRALALQPACRPALIGLASHARRFGQKADAIALLERCIALAPEEMDAYVELGNVHLDRKDPDRAQVFFRRAQQLQPLISWRTKQQRADFSVVLLDTPGASCTPINYLLGTAPYDRHFYCVTPEPSPHVELLRARGDVVFNLIADADNGADILPVAAELADLVGRPTVNHPRQVMRSSRDAAAALFAGIALCRVPRTRRFTAATLRRVATEPALLADMGLPLLVRPTGKHGGDEFEKFDAVAAIADFAAARDVADFYVTEYADYRSADGHYRKYRFIAVDGELFPYHLAIHDDWKVHHFRTDMAQQAWMRAEEERFLAAPGNAFDAPCMNALQQMVRALGLDYCGLDVALDAQGRIVLFEANAAMLVHDEKGDTYAYKNTHVLRIKQAVDAMLARRADVAPERCEPLLPKPSA